MRRIIHVILFYITVHYGDVQGQNENDEQRFYIELQKIENFTTVEECLREDECLRDPGSHLDCMCGAQVEKTEMTRLSCRGNVTQSFYEEITLPSELGFCSRAFLAMGYTSSLVNVNDTNTTGLKTYSTLSLSEKIVELGNYSKEFHQLLNRTIVGVYLRQGTEQRDVCKV